MRRNWPGTRSPAGKRPRRYLENAASGATPLAALRLAAFLEVSLPSALLDTAREALVKAETPEPFRLAAVDALSRGHKPELEAAALDATLPPTTRVAALRHAPGAAARLLPGWDLHPSALRAAALEQLAASPAGVPLLLEAIQTSRIPAAEVPAHLADQLRRTGDAITRSLAARTSSRLLKPTVRPCWRPGREP